MSVSTPKAQPDRLPRHPGHTRRLTTCRQRAWQGRQRGAALIVGLALLVIMMVGGIAAMRSTTLNEKITSNQRNKTISLMAAETGIRQFNTWFQSAAAATFPSTPATQNAWQTGQSIPSTGTGSLNANVGSGSFGYFWVDASSVSWDTSQRTVSLTITGHALSAANGGSVLATTQIDVTLKASGKNLLPSMPPAPLGFVGNITTFDPANSNPFLITSSTTPAIATNSSGSASTVTGAIPSGRVDSYKGVNPDGTACADPCVRNLSFGSPWGDASALKSLVNQLIAKGEASGVKYLTGTGETVVSLSNDFPVTIVQGDARFNGSSGVPNGGYTGLLIVLGGSLHFNGMGNSTFNGGIFLANIDLQSPNPTFGPLSFSVNGGGNGLIQFNPNPGNILNSGSPFQRWKEK